MAMHVFFLLVLLYKKKSQKVLSTWVASEFSNKSFIGRLDYAISFRKEKIQKYRNVCLF